MKFSEHGSYSIELHDDCIVVNATGPFNEQFVVKYKNELQKVMQGLDGRKWRQIIIMNEMSIFTPEAESALCETLELRMQHGLISSAVVYGDTLCNLLIHEQLSRCYLGAKVPHKFFDNLKEAKQWVKNSKH
jgi:hypothetical protein